jgi:hypothetical protein
VLRVTDGDGKLWHADAGFGIGTLLDPIPFGPDPEAACDRAGASASSRWVISWCGKSVARMAGQTVRRANPHSPFVFGLIVVVNQDDGRRELMCDWRRRVQRGAFPPRSG